MPKLILVIFCLFYSIHACAEDEAIATLFAQSHINGTMVISSLHSGQTMIHNDSRAKQRLPIASTFKILNTLISLEENVIFGKDSVIKWDGHRYDLPDWNHDQTLESAFKVSCVWCFQELAHRVGAEKYRDYLHQLSFGELREPFNETTFWLDGSLVISPIEQVEFLKKVYQRSLPFRPSSYDTLQQIMLVEQTTTFTIRAKTGWATKITPSIGWYVGYVETLNDVCFFATNLDIGNEKDLPTRQKLTRQALQAKGIIK